MKQELDAIENYFLERINEIHRMCNDGTPWVFLSACSLLDCISTMVYNKDATGEDYKDFINEYL